MMETFHCRLHVQSYWNRIVLVEVRARFCFLDTKLQPTRPICSVSIIQCVVYDNWKSAVAVVARAQCCRRCRWLSDYCRCSFIAHNRPLSVEPWVVRLCVTTPPNHSGDDDEKSCWRSSTEYNSICSRSSSPTPTPPGGVLTANAVITETDLFAYPLLRSGAAYIARHLNSAAR